jgi:uncharacterized OB-fold protein
MAKLYKVRKRCMICGNVFYPRYAGSLYCEDCKNKKKIETKKTVTKRKVLKLKKKKTIKLSPKKTVKKSRVKNSKKK